MYETRGKGITAQQFEKLELLLFITFSVLPIQRYIFFNISNVIEYRIAKYRTTYQIFAHNACRGPTRKEIFYVKINGMATVTGLIYFKV